MKLFSLTWSDSCSIEYKHKKNFENVFELFQLIEKAHSIVILVQTKQGKNEGLAKEN